MQVEQPTRQLWRTGRTSIFVAALALAAATAWADHRFNLTVPGRPDLSSSAVLSGNVLTVTDATGRSFRYTRRPQFDTPDGRYHAFFNRRQDQFIRWPVDNQGSMLVGDETGLLWRRSQQRIVPVDRVAPGPGRPIIPPGRPAGLAHHLDTTIAAGNQLVAHIDNSGTLRVYAGGEDHWELFEGASAAGLVPGAPLAFIEGAGGRPRILTVNSAGRLIQVSDRSGVTPVFPEIRLMPGSAFAVDQTGPNLLVYAIDDRDRLLEMEPGTRRVDLVASDPELMAGGPLTVAARAGRSRGTQTLLLIDRRGLLIRYDSGPRGWERTPVATGFVPGSQIAWFATDAPSRPDYVAAVDWNGEIQMLESTGPGWSRIPPPPVRLTPGAPLSIAATPDGPLLSAMTQSGTWMVWWNQPAGGWTSLELARGFPLGAPVRISTATATGFAVDLRGRVIASHRHDGVWHAYVCRPDVDYTPRLVDRNILPNPALPPATVRLANNGQEDLHVQIVDAAASSAPRELRIPAGRTVQERFERDAGARIVETYLVPGPGGTWIEQTDEYDLPPQPRYTLVVWAERVTYQYIDRRKQKPIGALPGFDLKTHVSVGVIPLPPGPALQNGAVIDLLREASFRNNPGAAVWYGPPSAGPTVVPEGADGTAPPPGIP
ncbi:hypothetical protein Mal4_13110 [Maioricimonas rarisocia]|uniref:Uncharacterized protein n=1 Tax=Maioricimonas rarisocia TaxID=2528026 RepID=A0A517Z3G8_9PLAN|nr:hypothetical protein [Maioricimonas rarisocia]QDU37008.1 hypothetical protein Mal4_13110 [Maioricimonas rarisocia]